MTRAKRKWEHIQYALQDLKQNNSSGFNDVTFVHQSLPNLALVEISLKHFIGELPLSSPIFINAMTGGGGEQTTRINGQLAIIANELGMAMAVGSQMSALKDPVEKGSYEIVRKENPTGIIFANLGSEASVEQAKMAVEMIAANALQIHLNVVQEITMPEGDRDFRGALKRIENIVHQINVPVIIKEVGFGMSKETVEKLFSIGVTAVDVGGYGGTNFAFIENARRMEELTFFNDWGIPTAISIVEAKSACPSCSIISSGGIKQSLDIVKSIALGADAVGLAGFFLKPLIENGLEDTIQKARKLEEEIRYMMLALGVRSIKELQNVPLVISGNVHHWLKERGINTQKYSQR
ncbi:type 2 isopentenyl-diphosphate Delta-isomerase [Bacillus sp. CGMCC 1.16607]|uniref:type 2 isopentenyl-diphosphate Delta-isomerase n=1 Tax=Bacillus sp. CGMCC 1.16607 TaxID=3351842 RepID=UPI0036278E61